MIRCMTASTSPILVYGIANCDTVKKARAWLTANGATHEFIDYKKQAPSHALLAAWAQRLGWQALLNTRGTTWRRLDPATQAGVNNAGSALSLMLAQPSLIRRPAVLWPSGELTLGFEPAAWQTRLRPGSAPRA